MSPEEIIKISKPLKAISEKKITISVAEKERIEAKTMHQFYSQLIKDYKEINNYGGLKTLLKYARIGSDACQLKIE